VSSSEVSLTCTTFSYALTDVSEVSPPSYLRFFGLSVAHSHIPAEVTLSGPPVF
jgi:hypothetical protein